jgi:hypothetical protein
MVYWWIWWAVKLNLMLNAVYLCVVMEKLLKSKGIQLVVAGSQEGDETFYAYNQDLLDKNLLIEFYHYEIDPDSEGSEIETAVFVLAIDGDCSYNFTMYYEMGLVETPPIVLFRIITDIIDFIKVCEKEQVIHALSPIATGVSSSKEWTEPKDREIAYAKDSAKFNSVMQLIELKKSSLN